MIRCAKQWVGWHAGCVVGYPTKRWHRWRIVKWCTRWDPFDELEDAWMSQYDG